MRADTRMRLYFLLSIAAGVLAFPFVMALIIYWIAFVFSFLPVPK